MRLRTSRHPGEPDPWLVAIVAYQYTLLDEDQREILAFHLHPEGPSHVPTGPLTLAAVTRLAIEAFGVQPLRTRWDATLRRSDVVLAASHHE
jgi:hypothetical protein